MSPGAPAGHSRSGCNVADRADRRAVGVANAELAATAGAMARMRWRLLRRDSRFRRPARHWRRSGAPALSRDQAFDRLVGDQRLLVGALDRSCGLASSSILLSRPGASTSPSGNSAQSDSSSRTCAGRPALEKGRLAFHQSRGAPAPCGSVQLAQQVEEVLGNFFAQHVVIDGAKRAADRTRAGPCVFFLSGEPEPDWPRLPLALLVPLNLSSPSRASICARSFTQLITRRTLPTAPGNAAGRARCTYPPPRAPRQSGAQSVANWGRKPNRPSFVPPLANSGAKGVAPW